MEEVDDLRVRRTRKLLQEALMELTVEKGFAAVTVRDITERAMVNRSTFYRHYVDKYDLLEQYMTRLGESVSEAAAIVEKANPGTPEKVPPGLLVLIKHVQEYADFYRIMLGQNGDPLFTQRFRQMSENRYRHLFTLFGGESDPKAPPIDMKLNYISCAGIGAILWWLENDQPCTPEQLAIWLGQLSMTSAGLALGPKRDTA
jgi:AcrR family transcriptional regulator